MYVHESTYIIEGTPDLSFGRAESSIWKAKEIFIPIACFVFTAISIMTQFKCKPRSVALYTLIKIFTAHRVWLCMKY